MANSIEDEVSTIMKGRGIGREFYGKEKLEDLAKLISCERTGMYCGERLLASEQIDGQWRRILARRRS